MEDISEKHGFPFTSPLVDREKDFLSIGGKNLSVKPEVILNTLTEMNDEESITANDNAQSPPLIFSGSKQGSSSHLQQEISVIRKIDSHSDQADNISIPSAQKREQISSSNIDM